MKRNNVKLQLKRRLELVRTTVRELTPSQLDQIKGGNDLPTLWQCPTCCCPYYSD